MCGIAGYIGDKNASKIIIELLKKLEYRGYDSAGIATLNKGKISLIKYKGKISELQNSMQKRNVLGSLGLGHTRWATHGKPSRANAHPHQDCSGRIIVVHNGIIENFIDLKNKLKKQGCKFKSETDTEVIAHLISRFYRKSVTIEEAVRKALKKLKGSYALGIMSLCEPDKVIVAKLNSPLAIGLGEKENFIVSDISAILNYTKKIIYLCDHQIAAITKDKVDIFSLEGKKVEKKIETIKYNIEEVNKGGFEHFMLKEIYEQPEVISKIISQYINNKDEVDFQGCNLKSDFLKGVKNLIIVACGTAYHAGLIGKYVMEEFIRIPVWVDLGSEFRYRNPVIEKNTLVIAISQSGETADTLAAVREAKKRGAKILSICNVLGSALIRESDRNINIQAGPEISVASTKAFTAQVTILYLLALRWASLKETLSKKQIKQALGNLKKIPHKQREIFKNVRKIKNIAKKHLHFGAFLYLARNINFPIALEGALKLKEISYIPTEGYASGEIKHGPIALIDEYRAVICVANDSFIFDKMISNVQEILARRGKIIIIASLGNEEVKEYAKEIFFIPKIDDIFSPLLTIIPLQLLAYYMAVLKGYDVDKPRNLAKSVTVE